MNFLIEKWNEFKKCDNELKSILLKAVNKTACPDTDDIASYKLSDDQKEVEVEYVVVASDPHTCVDFNETVKFPTEWFDTGFDIETAWKNKLVADKKQQILDLQVKADNLKEKAEDILAEYEEIAAEMKKLNAEIQQFRHDSAE